MARLLADHAAADDAGPDRGGDTGVPRVIDQVVISLFWLGRR